MPYEITNADVAARAARDMRRLASTVIELTEEAARGTVHIGDAAKIEEAKNDFEEFARGAANFSRIVFEQYRENLKKAQEEAAKKAEAAKKPEAEELAAEKAEGEEKAPTSETK